MQNPFFSRRLSSQEYKWQEFQDVSLLSSDLPSLAQQPTSLRAVEPHSQPPHPRAQGPLSAQPSPGPALLLLHISSSTHISLGTSLEALLPWPHMLTHGAQQSRVVSYSLLFPQHMVGAHSTGMYGASPEEGPECGAFHQAGGQRPLQLSIGLG